MTSRSLVNPESDQYALAFAKTEAAIIVVLFQVEVFGSFESVICGSGAGDAVQSQAAFVVEAGEAANEAEARALLG